MFVLCLLLQLAVLTFRPGLPYTVIIGCIHYFRVHTLLQGAHVTIRCIRCYHFRAGRTELGASASGALGVVGAASWIACKKPLGLLVPLFVSFAGVLEYAARGTSDLFPSMAARAQKHVDAGAEMTRTHRLAKLFNSELQETCPGNYK